MWAVDSRLHVDAAIDHALMVENLIKTTFHKDFEFFRPHALLELIRPFSWVCTLCDNAVSPEKSSTTTEHWNKAISALQFVLSFISGQMHIVLRTHSALTSMPFNHVPVCGLRPSKNSDCCVWAILQPQPFCLCSKNSWPHFYFQVYLHVHASLHQSSNGICQTCTMTNNNISIERPRECARLRFLATEFIYKRKCSSARWHLVNVSRRSRIFRYISCGEKIISQFNTFFFLCVISNISRVYWETWTMSNPKKWNVDQCHWNHIIAFNFTNRRFVWRGILIWIFVLFSPISILVFFLFSVAAVSVERTCVLKRHGNNKK